VGQIANLWHQSEFSIGIGGQDGGSRPELPKGQALGGLLGRGQLAPFLPVIVGPKMYCFANLHNFKQKSFLHILNLNTLINYYHSFSGHG